MNEEQENDIKYFDIVENKVLTYDIEKFNKKLDKLKKILQYAVTSMQKLGTYELSELAVSAELSAGAWIIKSNGSIAFKWKKPDKEVQKQS